MGRQTKGEKTSLVLVTIGWAWTTIGILGMTIGIDTLGIWVTESPRVDELLFILPGLLIAGIGAALWIREQARARQLMDL